MRVDIISAGQCALAAEFTRLIFYGSLTRAWFPCTQRSPNMGDPMLARLADYRLQADPFFHDPFRGRHDRCLIPLLEAGT